MTKPLVVSPVFHGWGFGREDIEDVVFTSNTIMLGRPGVLIGCEAGQRHVVDEIRFG